MLKDSQYISRGCFGGAKISRLGAVVCWNFSIFEINRITFLNNHSCQRQDLISLGDPLPKLSPGHFLTPVERPETPSSQPLLTF
jgi:hypothetical protein